MPRISSPRPLDLTKPFVTSSQSYGSKPFDLSENLVTWYRDVQGDFVPDLSGMGNTARCAGSASFLPVVASSDTPELNLTQFDIRSFSFGGGAAGTAYPHIKTVNAVNSPTASIDHSFTDGTNDLPFSISFWIKPDAVSSQQYVISKINSAAPLSGYEWSVEILNGGPLRFIINGEGRSSRYLQAQKNAVISAGEWQHVALTYDGSASTSGISMYVNGSALTALSLSSSSYVKMSKTSTPICIGNRFSSTSYATVSSEEYDGLIHSVAIWKNRKLTSSEIAGLYNAYLNGPGGEARSGFISRSPRLHLRELDDLPGSYPTVRRSGDSTRTGALTSSFNDSTTIVFSDTETAVFPSMLPKGSPFAAQAVDIIGQESDIRVALPIRSFQHPNHLHYSPTEAIGPFNENRAIPASDFFLSGTRSEILPGFNSPKRSKISFEIDVTPSRETTFTRNMSLRNTSEGQPVGPTNTGFMYYNFNRREWEQIGAKDPALPSVLYYEYDMSGDVGFGNNSSGTLPAQFSVSPSRAFAPDSEKEILGYSKIGTPISAFGAPNNTMYHATASQCLKLSNFISNPFLLEGVRVEISEAKAQRVQGDSLVGTPDIDYLGRSALQQSGSIKDIDNYVFFMYRQSRKNRIVDSISDVSSSERYLIASGSMTFWNSASFESNRVRYENQDVNFSLTHSPQFSYEFGLPYSSSYDVRLTDWDPSHDTYYYEDLLFDVTSNCVAHFNFEDDVVGGGSVVDKTGNGHAAAVDTYPVSKVVGPDNVSYSVGFPSTNYLGVDFFDSGAYISNRGYLSCGAIDSTSPSMRIDHASDLQLSFSQGFSIAFWVQPYAVPLPQNQWIISKAQDYPGTQVEYYVQVLTTGEIRWCVSGSGGGHIEKLTSDSWIDSTSWSHVVVTYNGGTNNNALKIFVNGSQVNTTGINHGTFTAPVNYSHDVLVGSLGDLPYSFVGYIGSLEFYNANLSASSAKKLYFLQETPFLNSISTSVGQFTGSINMEIAPTVCNRQVFGISSYSNYELQNVWIGGTSFEKFRKNSWNVGSLTGLPANPFFRLTGSSGVGYVEGVALDDRIYSSKIDSRASKFLGNDTNESGNPKSQEVSGISTVNDATNQSVGSPYLLMPGDELIFGIDSGICSMPLYDQGNLSHLTGSHFVISPKSCKITLFGSLIKDGNESLSSLNQDLSSNSIHEAIGSEQILDQFQIEPKSSYYGSYLDEIVTGSMITPALGGLIFSSEDQDHSRRVISQVSLGGAGTTGSLQRFVKMTDKSERSYDSCLPSYADFLSGSNELDVGLFNNTTYNIVNFERISVEFSDFEAAVLEKNGFLPNQFPFKFNPTRRVDVPRGFIQNNNVPVGFTYLDLIVATDDRDTARQNGFMVTRDLIFRTNYNYHKNYLNVTPYSYGHKIGSGSSGASLVNEKAGAFRYGISNVEPDFTACCWRTDHYGQLRDMLEPRRLTARFDGFNPVKIRFVSGSTVLADPTETHSQNISVFATSSMPYFDDGVARNRSDNPDESLLNLFTIAT